MGTDGTCNNTKLLAGVTFSFAFCCTEINDRPVAFFKFKVEKFRIFKLCKYCRLYFIEQSIDLTSFVEEENHFILQKNKPRHNVKKKKNICYVM